MKTAQLHSFSEVLLVGAGVMSREYFKVLQALEAKHTVVCRSKNSAEQFFNTTGHPVLSGGLKKYFQNNKKNVKTAIIAVSVENLASVSMELLQRGFKKILIEKPAGIYFDEIVEIAKLAENNEASVFVAYNRRFYGSSQKAREIIELDGGATSFNFEFTEWTTEKPLVTDNAVQKRWFLSNSSHVVDLAFFLGGKPKEISSYTGGKDNLSWHPSASTFCGSGLTVNDALFSYHADWTGPGRWGLEIVTNQHRLILRPMEQLQMQTIGSVKTKFVEISDHLDKSFKPGLYKQVKAFLNDDFKDFCTIADQQDMLKYFYTISDYTM